MHISLFQVGLPSSTETSIILSRCGILQVGKFIQLTSTFFTGFIVAFAQGWLLTLVMLCTIPPLVITGGIMANIVAKMASRGQAAYGEAATVVEQTIGSIRTVGFVFSFFFPFSREHLNDILQILLFSHYLTFLFRLLPLLGKN